jgi:hypothetical protein
MAGEHWYMEVHDGVEVYFCKEPGCRLAIPVGSKDAKRKIRDAEDCILALNRHWSRNHGHKWVEVVTDENKTRLYCKEECGFYSEVGETGKRSRKARSRDNCQHTVNYHWEKFCRYQPRGQRGPRGQGEPSQVDALVSIASALMFYCIASACFV